MLSGSGKVSASFFYGDGSNLTGITASAAVAGSNTEVQFNDDGATAASSDFTFATGSSTLSIVTGKLYQNLIA